MQQEQKAQVHLAAPQAGRTSGDALANVPRDEGSASLIETFARRERMAMAQSRRAIRARALSDAKAAIREHLVRSPEELLSLMQCIQAAVEKPTMDTRLREAGERLLEQCVDLDGELNGLGVEA